MRLKSLMSFLFCLACVSSVYAKSNVDLIPARVTLTSQHTLAASDASKIVYLMPMQVNEIQKTNLFKNRNPYSMTSFSIHNSNLPSSVFIGMNGVPVLDQGYHGSCVTFAVTAALDALIGQGDYISQFCNLELGSYLANDGYGMSGWEGAMPQDIIHQIFAFGIVSKATEQTQTCANLSGYPLTDTANEGAPMSLDEFKSKSEDLSGNMMSTTFLSGVDSFEMNNEEAQQLITRVKTELHKEESRASNNRIVFATFLPDANSATCGAGACGRMHQRDDSWVFSDNIKEDSSHWFDAGHEMVIIGYDDNAFAIDHAGKMHKGLFTLRNSWSADVGDQGNYYMSYEYFAKFVFEVDLLMGNKTGLL